MLMASRSHEGSVMTEANPAAGQSTRETSRSRTHRVDEGMPRKAVAAAAYLCRVLECSAIKQEEVHP